MLILLQPVDTDTSLEIALPKLPELLTKPIPTFNKAEFDDGFRWYKLARQSLGPLYTQIARGPGIVCFGQLFCFLILCRQGAGTGAS
jgi:hypothetical protein